MRNGHSKDRVQTDAKDVEDKCSEAKDEGTRLQGTAQRRQRVDRCEDEDGWARPQGQMSRARLQ